MSKKIICIFGLAGSGKSMQVNLLGKYFKLEVIRASRLLREFNKKDIKVKGWWEKEAGMQFTEERLNDLNIDRAFDQKLAMLVKKGNVIVDSWSLPWLLKKEELCSIYLIASQETRAKRISERDKIKKEQALQAVKKRDLENVKLFYNLYNARIDKDFNKFNLVLQTDALGINQVFEILKAFIKQYYKTKR